MALEREVSAATWYLDKAEQCERQAADSADPLVRVRYRGEARLWREIAAGILKKERR
jgi:hypothetical protein